MGRRAEAHRLKELQAKVMPRLVYHGKVIEVRSDTVQFEEGPPQVWDVTLHPGAVAVVPIDAKGKIFLVEQWRRAIEKVTVEIPAGLLEKGEAPEVCAQRELQEEIGYRANSLKSIGGCYSAPGISNEYIHLFVAKNLEKSARMAEDTDGIDVRIVSFEEAFEMMESGEICDAKTVAAILRVARCEL